MSIRRFAAVLAALTVAACTEDVPSPVSDSQAPSVTSIEPADGATGVALDTIVKASFDEAIAPALLAMKLAREDGSPVEGTVAIADDARSATLTPSAALEENATYALTIAGLADAAGNAGAEVTARFTTSAIPPELVSSIPEDGAEHVALDTKLLLTFSEPVSADSAAGAIRLTSASGELEAAITVDGDKVELTPAAPLAEDTEYRVVIAGTLADRAGVPVAAPLTIAFRTEVPPRILYFAPRSGETGVPTNAVLGFAVNKPISGTIKVTPKSGSTVEALNLYEDGLRIDGSATWDAASLTVRVGKMENGAPATWSPGKRYTLEIDGARLLDLNGNRFGGRPSTTFVVGAGVDTTGPSVESTFPQSGDTGVDRHAQPHAIFDEPLDPSTVSPATVKLLDGATALAGRVEYLQTERRVRFVPAQPLPGDRQLTFQIGNGVKDLAGNAKAVVNNIEFTTQANSPPSVTRIWPADGSTDVHVNTAIRIDFSEAIDPSTLDVKVASEPPGVITGTVSWDAQSHSAIFRPDESLPAGRTISVTVEAGLSDLDGAATSQSIEAGSFQTVADSAHDVIAPEVTSTTPAEGAANVAAGTAVTFRFSEALDLATVDHASFSFEDDADRQISFALSVEASGNSVTLRPSRPLASGTRYTVAALAAITDLAGNALDEEAPSSVLTFSVDGTRPSVSRTSPVAGSTVGNSVRIEVVFDEELDPATIDSSSMTLSFGGSTVAASVTWDAASRTAILQPAGRLADGEQTVTLDASRIADLAGNKLNPSQGTVWTWSFEVSSTGPSVAAVDPCNSLVDAYDLATSPVTFTFDRGVKKVGGDALDGEALKLRLAGADVAATVTHNPGEASATLVPAAPLEQGKQYQVVATTLIADGATDAAMASEYTCTFETQRVLFSDLVDDLATTGYTVGNAQGGNRWTRVNSTLDGTRDSIVWKGGNSSDGQNYVRDARLLVGADDYTITAEWQVDLTGLTEAELRLDAFHDINGAAGDYGRVVAISGTTTRELFGRFTGTTSAYITRMGKDSGNLTSMVGTTVTLRFELFINGHQGTGAGPAGGKGLFLDNLYVVGK